jgi:hypothetical protein
MISNLVTGDGKKMQNENSETKQNPIKLSELSFAELAKLRRQREASEKIQKQETPEVPKKEIIQESTPAEYTEIELAENIDFESDYFKLPNNIYKIAKLQDEKEHCAYIYLFRLSYGWKRNFCRFGYDAILKNTSLSSRSSVIRAVEGLIQKNHIIKIRESRQKESGTLYRVLTPDEILSGIFKLSIVKLSIVKLSISKTSIVKMGIVKNENEYSQIEYSQNEYTKKNKQEMDSTSVVNLTILNLTTNKDNRSKDNIKDTLSQDQIIDLFYKSIGQTKISKAKRERAKKCFEELIQDGFTNDDIQFAIEWTLTNMKEKPYDFSIIKDTISQAMAQKDKIEKEQKLQVEKEKSKTQREEQEKEEAIERENIIAIKQNLNPTERSELRNKALELIRNTEGIKEHLITEVLIEAKENEMLKLELSERK